MESEPSPEQPLTRDEILGRCAEGLTADDLPYLTDPEAVPDDVLIDGLFGALPNNGVEDPETFLRDKGILE